MKEEGVAMPLLPQVDYIANQDIALCVHLWSQQGEPLILLNGGPGMPDYLAPLAGLLTDDFRVVSYDQRGTGGSRVQKGGYGLDAHVEDLATVMRALDPGPWHILGHSWGGLLAQLYAQKFPETVKSLFLCNAMTGVGRDYLRMEPHLLRYYRQAAGPLGWAKMDICFLLLWMPGIIGNFGARCLYKQIWRSYFTGHSTKPRINPHWLRGIKRHAVRHTFMAICQNDAGQMKPVKLPAHVPVLVLYGDHDVFGPEIQTVFNRYPWARKEIIPLCGHVPWFQNPIAFAALLYHFYAQFRIERQAA